MLRLYKKFLCLLICAALLLPMVPWLCLPTTAVDRETSCDHQYEVVTVPATCTQDGSETGICTLCGETNSQFFPATGHRYELTVKEPTCYQDGMMSVFCLNCHIGYGSSLPATGHQYEDGKCTICGAVPQVTISGNINCFGNGKVTLVLTGTDTVETFTTVYGEYDFTTTPGQYTLAVYKADHPPREYQVTLNATDVTLDVKLHLIGDIDGNNKVTVGDLAKLYGHLKGNSLITDEYQLLCANVNGGTLNLGDAATLYAHIKSTTPLY